MNQVGLVWRSLQFALLVTTVPFAFVWARVPEGPGSIVVPAYLTMLVFALMSQDARMLERGRKPRLTITHGTGRHDLSLVRTTRAIAGIATAVIALAALVMGHVSFAVVVAVLLAITVALAALPGGSPLRFVEVFWPLTMLLLPLTVVSLVTPGELPRPAVAATGLGALLLSASVLICLMRDVAMDRTDAMVTTVTTLGTSASAFLFVLVLALAVLLGAWGAAAGWWHWSAAAIVSIGSLVAVWAVAAGQYSSAGPTWWAGHAAAAIVVAATAPAIG